MRRFLHLFLIALTGWLLGCRPVALRPELPTRDDALALGNPSGATPSPSNYDNYLITRPQYTLAYNRSRGTANWVAWHLSPAWRGNAPRQNNFRVDRDLPSGWFRVGSDDYTSTGFDRGHLCPSEDRDADPEDNAATFLMTNIVPQAPQNNQEPWRQLEEYCRLLSQRGYELYLFAGGYGRGGSGSRGGRTNTLVDGNLLVPSRLWKIAVVLPQGTNDLARLAPDTRVIAVDLPNTEAAAQQPWASYRTTVAAIETATGFNFLSQLPTSLQQRLENQPDTGPTR
jgi:endonuclease G, mitochondrial